jgi:hypothetical protein
VERFQITVTSPDFTLVPTLFHHQPLAANIKYFVMSFEPRFESDAVDRVYGIHVTHMDGAIKILKFTREHLDLTVLHLVGSLSSPQVLDDILTNDKAAEWVRAVRAVKTKKLHLVYCYRGLLDGKSKYV